MTDDKGLILFCFNMICSQLYPDLNDILQLLSDHLRYSTGLISKNLHYYTVVIMQIQTRIV